jgi:hemolysin activation/secretion protein
MLRRFPVLAILTCVLAVALARAVPAQAPAENEARAYPVSAIRIETPEELADPELAAELARLEVKLGEDPDRWTVPSPNRPTRALRIGDIGSDGVVSLDRAAIIEVCTAVVRDLQRRGRMSQCRPDPRDIARGEDRREGRDELRLQVVLTRLAEVRTYASGERALAAGGEPTNHPIHRKLRADAPGARRGSGAAPLLDASQLEEYAARLSRHPGRTVGLVYSRASARDAGLTADLVVTESKPWAMYFQTTDTGTRNTGRYRNRVGFTHTQLTGNDDILQLEYMTSDFDQIQSASTSYEAPLAGLERARVKLFGAMSRFDNDELGFTDAHFEGARSELGFKIVDNVFQRGSFFADLSIGLRGQSLMVDNGVTGVRSRDRFLLPSIGARIEQRGAFAGFTGGIELESNLAKLAGTSVRSRDTRTGDLFFDGAAGLGRAEPDADFRILRFDLSGSLFLDPLLAGGFDADTALVHEIYARMGGQHAFDDRLVPQEQAVAGGKDTVRGYEQAVAVGDSVYLASLEYRYHLPRSLRPRPASRLPGWLGSRRFRYAPEQSAGDADWDLVLKGSFDFARVKQNDRLGPERDETLVGAALGVEIRVRRNFTVGFDLGVPLRDGHAIDVDTGDPELHFSLTALY